MTKERNDDFTWQFGIVWESEIVQTFCVGFEPLLWYIQSLYKWGKKTKKTCVQLVSLCGKFLGRARRCQNGLAESRLRCCCVCHAGPPIPPTLETHPDLRPPPPLILTWHDDYYVVTRSGRVFCLHTDEAYLFKRGGGKVVSKILCQFLFCESNIVPQEPHHKYQSRMGIYRFWLPVFWQPLHVRAQTLDCCGLHRLGFAVQFSLSRCCYSHGGACFVSVFLSS